MRLGTGRAQFGHKQERVMVGAPSKRLILRGNLVPEARLELAQGCPYRIFSPARLPFHHSGTEEYCGVILITDSSARMQEPGRAFKSSRFNVQGLGTGMSWGRDNSDVEP